MHFFENKLMQQKLFSQNYLRKMQVFSVSIPQVIVDPPHGTENSF